MTARSVPELGGSPSSATPDIWLARLITTTYLAEPLHVDRIYEIIPFRVELDITLEQGALVRHTIGFQLGAEMEHGSSCTSSRFAMGTRAWKA